jgi:hypothetical protein
MNIRLFNDCSQLHGLYNVEYSSDSERICGGGNAERSHHALFYGTILAFARRI